MPLLLPTRPEDERLKVFRYSSRVVQSFEREVWHAKLLNLISKGKSECDLLVAE